MATDLAPFIEHTILRPEATAADVARICAEACDRGFHAVCVNPGRVALAASLLADAPVTVCTVVGFPLGATTSAVKAAETARAVADGAGEIDMVMDVGRLKDGDDAAVREDIAAVVAAARDGGALTKVILETVLLDDAEKRRACAAAVAAGADFVKTSTGFAGGGATVDDVRLMAAAVGAAGLGVKASGGVRTREDAERLIVAGATRLGTSSGVVIVGG